MIEKIDTASGAGVNASVPQKVEFNTIIKQKGQSKAEEIINRFLYAIVVLLLLFILSTFFVKRLPNVVINLRSLAIDAVWLSVCCYTIGELIKRIFFNKGKCTNAYETAMQSAETALNSITAEESAKCAEYCQEYAESVFNRKKARGLANARVSEEEYHEKYFSLSCRELKKRYGGELTKAQIKTLAMVNKLKVLEYNPDFFTTATDLEPDCMPSERYNASRENKKNMLTSALFAAASSIFGLTLAGEIIFSFSATAILMAIIKIASVIIFSSFKATFGWNLAMRTEINHYKLQEREVGDLKHWYKKKYKGE